MKTIVLSNPIKKNSLSKDFGTIYRYNNHIYRTIENKHKKQVEGLINNQPLMERLHQKGLVKTTKAPVCTKEYDLILEHELIDFHSYMGEWSLPAKIDATLMAIDLLDELVRNDWCLWDGHSFNIMFDYTKPKWIDFHSILPLSLTTAWWNEFKFYVFDELIDDDTLWNTELDKVMHGIGNCKEKILIFLKEIRNSIGAIEISPTKTPWYDYPKLNNNLDNKQTSTLQLMEKVKPLHSTFLDIGGNVGWYSKAAYNMGYKVITTDTDEACIADLYIDAKNSNDKILPLVSDFKSCLDYSKNYPSFATRLKCDVTLSLALLHHLVFFQDCDFSFISERLNALSKGVAIVQFITREDSYVKHWLKTSVNKDYSWYTMDNFISEMTKYFPKYQIFESSPIGRKLILFEK